MSEYCTELHVIINNYAKEQLIYRPVLQKQLNIFSKVKK